MCASTRRRLSAPAISALCWALAAIPAAAHAQAEGPPPLPPEVLETGDRIRLLLRDPPEEVRGTLWILEGSRLMLRTPSQEAREVPVLRIRRLERWEPDPRNRRDVFRGAARVGGICAAIGAIMAYSFSPKSEGLPVLPMLGTGALAGLVGGAYGGLATHLVLHDRGIWVEVRLR
jgi:hypothetical protein